MEEYGESSERTDELSVPKFIVSGRRSNLLEYKN
jgi:hypothetical protein